jgi:hypothetical protein
MPLLNKNSILTASKKRIKSVRIEELEESIYIRQLSGSERVELAKLWKSAENASPEDAFKMQCTVITMVVVDEYGDPIFSRSDIETISAMNARAIDQIAMEGLRASGLWAGAVEDAAKNSAPSPS